MSLSGPANNIDSEAASMAATVSLLQRQSILSFLPTYLPIYDSNHNSLHHQRHAEATDAESYISQITTVDK